MNPETSNHQPEPWYWEAESTHCPHGTQPDRERPAWDAWWDRHQPADQDVYVCLDAPMGDHCPECSDALGAPVAWSDCSGRPRPRPGSAPVVGHEPVEAWAGGTECLERECEEYADDEGDDKPEVERCSHVSVELICAACSGTDADGYFEPAVAWTGPHSARATAGASA